MISYNFSFQKSGIIGNPYLRSINCHFGSPHFPVDHESEYEVAYRAGVHRVPLGAWVHTARQLAATNLLLFIQHLFLLLSNLQFSIQTLHPPSSFSHTLLSPPSLLQPLQQERAVAIWNKEEQFSARSFDLPMQNFWPTQSDWTAHHCKLVRLTDEDWKCSYNLK